ncbi:oxamate carbamoyltransferase subunit AllH family protein [Microbacterium sp. 22242]|uniref:oxamate carbamoyltransferase subunit AllH family protein n=1 Tax=Microbacterium sp. 22242 TaxID=3453896 RepID=UPI003F86A529
MTPVATPVAVRALTWDAALAETLAHAADDAFSRLPAVVHSVHRRALNLRIGDELIALVSSGLEDAPATVRVPVEDWTALARQGDEVRIEPGGFRIETASGPITVLTGSATAWTAAEACLCTLSPDRLLRAEARISMLPRPTGQSAFGRAAAALLEECVQDLGEALLQGDPAGITAAATPLLGLGEGLTPSGDDVLTGLAFLSAQHGMRLRSAVASLAAALENGADRTTLLSVVTVRHALQARATRALHDLALAIGDDGDDGAGIDPAARRIAAIGHTSGADILTGVRLALRTEAALRALPDPVPATPTSGTYPKETAR